MSYVIELAWPAVALVFGALVVWRVEKWASWKQGRLQARLSDAESRLNLAERRIDHAHQMISDNGTIISRLLELEREVERVLKTPTPPAERHTAQSLARFK